VTLNHGVTIIKTVKMIIEGKPATISAHKKSVFEFLTDFNNFESLMPDQVVNWKSDKESCSFTIKGMTSLSLKYIQKTPFELIDIVPEGKSPIKFNLKIFLETDTLDDQKTVAKAEIDADLNPMMAMLAKKPLENLVNIISERLNDEFQK